MHTVALSSGSFFHGDEVMDRGNLNNQVFEVDGFRLPQEVLIAASSNGFEKDVEGAMFRGEEPGPVPFQ